MLIMIIMIMIMIMMIMIMIVFFLKSRKQTDVCDVAVVAASEDARVGERRETIRP